VAVHRDHEAYHELCAYTLTHGDSKFIHQHVVDAFAAQNANQDTKPIALTFALVGLFLRVEKGFSGREVQRAHQYLARAKRVWPSFPLPHSRGSMTALDVMGYEAGIDRDRAIYEWCAGVWEAFCIADEQTVATVRSMCQGLPRFGPA
jgi:hypothetical protein